MKKDIALIAEEVCKTLADTAIARLENKSRTFPGHSNRASEIGHPCHAYLYFAREAWQSREKPSATLQSIFDEGNLHESHIQQKILLDAGGLGWGFVGQQQDFAFKELQITGHVDGILIVKDTAYPLEIKTMSDQIWQRISTAKDFVDSKYTHLQKYYGQMQAYLFLNNSEAGIFALKNKTTGMMKYIPCPFDYEYSDAMLKRVKAVNDAISAQVVPEKILKDSYCDDCAFRTLCLGDAVRSVERYDNERLIAALKMREENTEAKKKYEEAKEIINEECGKVDKKEFVAGSWVIKRTYYAEKTKTFTQKAYWTNRIVKGIW